ncbi:hypothetical protein [Candidatus Tisiphia endosymbiont of Nemotelus uliginosus]|uniref:hypothetical protein n=1 Tax=Candidatus Tisiphia endosymbiont of Nemotelus uliginosus TaxID=3077926 RepID=UPI0035C87EDE
MSCIDYTTKIKFSYFTVLLLTVIIYQYLNIDIVLAAIEYKTNVKQRILPYLDITFKTRHLNYNTSNLAFFIPITQADNSLLFLDVGYIIDNNSNRKFNIGLVYRYQLADDVVVGTGPYIDRIQSNLKHYYTYSGFNAHFLTSTWQSQANIYLALTKKKKFNLPTTRAAKRIVAKQNNYRGLVNDKLKVHEQIFNGVDLSVSYAHPQFDRLRIGVTGYVFQSKRLPKIWGWGQNIIYEVSRIMSLEAEYLVYNKKLFNNKKGNFYIGVNFNIPLGTASKLKSYNTKMYRLFSTRVKRAVPRASHQTGVKAGADSALVLSPTIASPATTSNNQNTSENVLLVEEKQGGLFNVDNSTNAVVVQNNQDSEHAVDTSTVQGNHESNASAVSSTIASVTSNTPPPAILAVPATSQQRVKRAVPRASHQTGVKAGADSALVLSPTIASTATTSNNQNTSENVLLVEEKQGGLFNVDNGTNAVVVQNNQDSEHAVDTSTVQGNNESNASAVSNTIASVTSNTPPPAILAVPATSQQRVKRAVPRASHQTGVKAGADSALVLSPTIASTATTSNNQNTSENVLLVEEKQGGLFNVDNGTNAVVVQNNQDSEHAVDTSTVQGNNESNASAVSNTIASVTSNTPPPAILAVPATSQQRVKRAVPRASHQTGVKAGADSALVLSPTVASTATTSNNQNTSENVLLVEEKQGGLFNVDNGTNAVVVQNNQDSEHAVDTSTVQGNNESNASAVSSTIAILPHVQVADLSDNLTLQQEQVDRDVPATGREQIIRNLTNDTPTQSADNEFLDILYPPQMILEPDYLFFIKVYDVPHLDGFHRTMEVIPRLETVSQVTQEIKDKVVNIIKNFCAVHQDSVILFLARVYNAHTLSGEHQMLIVKPIVTVQGATAVDRVVIPSKFFNQNQVAAAIQFHDALHDLATVVTQPNVTNYSINTTNQLYYVVNQFINTANQLNAASQFDIVNKIVRVPQIIAAYQHTITDQLAAATQFATISGEYVAAYNIHAVDQLAAAYKFIVDRKLAAAQYLTNVRIPTVTNNLAVATKLLGTGHNNFAHEIQHHYAVTNYNSTTKQLAEANSFINTVNQLAEANHVVNTVNQLIPNQYFVSMMDQLAKSNNVDNTVKQLAKDSNFINTVKQFAITNNFAADNNFVNIITQLAADNNFVNTINHLKVANNFVNTVNQLAEVNHNEAAGQFCTINQLNDAIMQLNMVRQFDDNPQCDTIRHTNITNLNPEINFELTSQDTDSQSQPIVDTLAVNRIVDSRVVTNDVNIPLIATTPPNQSPQQGQDDNIDNIGPLLNQINIRKRKITELDTSIDDDQPNRKKFKALELDISRAHYSRKPKKRTIIELDISMDDDEPKCKRFKALE